MVLAPLLARSPARSCALKCFVGRLQLSAAALGRFRCVAFPWPSGSARPQISARYAYAASDCRQKRDRSWSCGDCADDSGRRWHQHKLSVAPAGVANDSCRGGNTSCPADDLPHDLVDEDTEDMRTGYATNLWTQQLDKQGTTTTTTTTTTTRKECVEGGRLHDAHTPLVTGLKRA